MKRFATLLLLLIHAAYAQPPPAPLDAPPEFTPTPAETPRAEPVVQTPSPTPTPTPAPVSTATPTVRQKVDSLSPAELEDAIKALRAHFVNPAALNEEAINRATLQGLLERISPGATILPPKAATREIEGPFRAEILDDRIGYMRLGALTTDNVAEMDAALKSFKEKNHKSAILDLRATPPSSNFELAADVINRFAPKGRMLFTVKRPSARQERIYTSKNDPQFDGVLAVVVDADTSGAAEVIAAGLRQQAKAVVVGEATSGKAVEFADIRLRSGKLLRVAVAEVTMPESAQLFPKGLAPDLTVSMPKEQQDELLQLELERGVSQFVFESERPRMNEAALIAGVNPELDALQAAQMQGATRVPLRDTVLQRALDLLTAISIYETKAPR